MADPKVHLMVGLFGKSACGKDHVDVIDIWQQVTCEPCRKTEVFQKLESGELKFDDLHIYPEPTRPRE